MSITKRNIVVYDSDEFMDRELFLFYVAMRNIKIDQIALILDKHYKYDELLLLVSGFRDLFQDDKTNMAFNDIGIALRFALDRYKNNHHIEENLTINEFYFNKKKIEFPYYLQFSLTIGNFYDITYNHLEKFYISFYDHTNEMMMTLETLKRILNEH